MIDLTVYDGYDPVYESAICLMAYCLNHKEDVNVITLRYGRKKFHKELVLRPDNLPMFQLFWMELHNMQLLNYKIEAMSISPSSFDPSIYVIVNHLMNARLIDKHFIIV